MKFKITYQDILDKDPCYDPIKFIPKDWSGTLIDILDVKNCSFEDRLWVVTWFLGDKLNRLFAVYCARQALHLIENPDPRSLKACDVAEKFALGKATKKELDSAMDAARHAAWDAASDAVRHAASDAASDAAWDAARHAARHAASDAARHAAWDAASDAAWADFEYYLRLLIKDELELK